MPRKPRTITDFPIFNPIKTTITKKPRYEVGTLMTLYIDDGRTRDYRFYKIVGHTKTRNSVPIAVALKSKELQVYCGPGGGKTQVLPKNEPLGKEQVLIWYPSMDSYFPFNTNNYLVSSFEIYNTKEEYFCEWISD